MIVQNIPIIPKFYDNNPKKMRQTTSVNLLNQNIGGDVFVRTSPVSFGKSNYDNVTIAADQLSSILSQRRFEYDDYETCTELLNKYELAGPIKDKKDAESTLYCILKEYYDYLKFGSLRVSGDRPDLKLEMFKKTLDSMVKKGAYSSDIQSCFDYKVYGFTFDQLFDPWDRWESPLPAEQYPKEIKEFFEKATEYRAQEILKEEKETRRIETEKFKVKQRSFNENIEEKYNIYDINNWDSILDEFLKPGSDSETAAIYFTLNNLPDIFLTEENKEQYQKVINRLSQIDGDWNITTEDTGDNLAHRAAVAENPLLIKLANEKGVSFSQKNNFDKTAFDYLEEYGSNLADLQGYKINYLELPDYAEKDLVSVMKMVLKHPYIDINSINKNGNNSAIVAAKNDSVHVLEFLNGIEDFDINYRNPKTGKNALESAANADTMYQLLKNPRINPNLTDGSNPPLAFKFLSNQYDYDIANNKDDMMKFQCLLNSSQLDIHATYKGQTLAEALKEYIDNLAGKDVDISHSMSKELTAILNRAIGKDLVNKTRAIVDKNGILSLKQIKEFLQFPGVEEVINEPLNDLNETIGFFVADTELTFGNIKEIEQIMNLLDKNNYDFIFRHNRMGQSCYDKAVDADNAVMIDYMRRIGT